MKVDVTVGTIHDAKWAVVIDPKGTPAGVGTMMVYLSSGMGWVDLAVLHGWWEHTGKQQYLTALQGAQDAEYLKTLNELGVDQGISNEQA